MTENKKANPLDPPLASDSETGRAFDRLYKIVQALRSPQGCPWDREQNPQSLRQDLLEESYECVEAINENDPPHIREELGDVFLLLTMISWMHEEEHIFSVKDTLQEIGDKLIRRHPHVFGDAQADNSQEVLKQWDAIKQNQEGRRPKDSILDQVSRSLPPLERAYKLQKKAAKTGFDWPDLAGVQQKLQEELSELEEARQAVAKHPHQAEFKDALEDEMGDVLFSVINLCRFLKIDPSIALQRGNTKFENRFRYLESTILKQGHKLEEESLQRKEELWQEAKRKGL